MNETCNVTTALSAFSSISLEEMSTIRLMNRTDTKYIVSLSALMDVLQRASNCYRVQEVQGERNIVYHTTYLDTPDYAMYLAHQNGRVIREKIRVRTYVSSGLTFLEVKIRIIKGGQIKADPGARSKLVASGWRRRVSSQLCLV